MTVAYHCRQGRLVPDYVCWEERTRHGRKNCQRIPGAGIDEAIGKLLVETVTPLALDVALAVQHEIQPQVAETDRIRQTQVERARYEATLAQRRYMQVDPDNRLVADELEADWNRKLRALADAQQEYERQRKADQVVLDAEQQSRILNLAADFPRLWQDPNIPQRERKRMVRLMLEDVTLLKDREITMHVRFKGGATKTIHIPLPLAWPQKHKTKPTVVAEIDRLLDDYTWIEIARILNEREIRTGAGGSFTVEKVKTVQWHFSLQSRYERLRARGLLTTSEVAQLLGISKRSVPTLQRKGSLRGHAYNDRSQYLYDPPSASLIEQVRPVRVHEVQCEA